MYKRIISLAVVALSVIGSSGIMTQGRAGGPDNAFDEHKYDIKDTPLSFSARRQKLTLEYIRKNYNALAEEITIVPIIIVIHWTACDSYRDAFNYFNRETLQADRGEIRRGGDVNVSAHYLVDRDGSIYRLVPDTWMARHVIGLNHCAIGIENIGGPALPLTQKQLEANAWLATLLARRYSTIEYVIGHHEYLEFRNGPLWRSRDPGYKAYPKPDPGKKFMEALRAKMEGYGFNLKEK
jgi:N-acetyl-anhydromuramyl-L-alanine amidase AmpD